MLLLSGIQHMAFCERQWALIHIEQVWEDSARTVEGRHLHERADDPFADESRQDVRIVRSLPVISRRLGLRGVCDVVEFRRQEDLIGRGPCQLPKHPGRWQPFPVEYKRGKPKPDDRDAVQLCAQAMALEEMMGIVLSEGYLFYGLTRRREHILLDEPLRQRTQELAIRMHELFRRGETPKAVKGRHCSQCSLDELCQPGWTLKPRSVQSYLDRMTKMEVGD